MPNGLSDVLGIIGATLQDTQRPGTLSNFMLQQEAKKQAAKKQQGLERLGLSNPGDVALSLGNVVSGVNNLPPGVQGPVQPLTKEQRAARAGQLAALQVPGSDAVLKEILSGQINEQEARELAQGDRSLSQKDRSLNQQDTKIGLSRRQEARLQRDQSFREQLFQSLSTGNDSGVTTGDVVGATGVKNEIATLKDKNRTLSAGLLDPELKDFTKAQIAANNEEIKNLRTMEKERRKLEEGLTPEQASKTALVKKGLKDVGEAIGLLTENDDSVSFVESLTASGINIPLTDVNILAGVPFTRGRRVHALMKNAMNAQLRAESGAAVPESEVNRAVDRFMPGPADDPDTRLMKMRSLEDLLQGTLDITKGPKRLQRGAVGGKVTLFGAGDEPSPPLGGTRIKFDAQGNVVQ